MYLALYSGDPTKSGARRIGRTDMPNFANVPGTLIQVNTEDIFFDMEVNEEVEITHVAAVEDNGEVYKSARLSSKDGLKYNPLQDRPRFGIAKLALKYD